MSNSGKLKRSDVISKKALNFGKKYAKNVEKCILSNEVLISQLEKINNLNKTIQENNQPNKREIALRKLIAYMMWLRFTDEFDCNEEETSKEINRLFDAYYINESVASTTNEKLMFFNKFWFVNKQIDAFLSKLNQ